jgi:DEAD/DEAH box helicase domain-containing protein
MKRIIVFDLETKKLADEVGGWSHIDKMGFAVGVTYDVLADVYQRFTEEHSDELIELLSQADQIIGFNLIRFDYTVLRPYGLRNSPSLKEKTTDILLDLYSALGFRISLDKIASATLDESKLADGLAAVRWFREGKVDLVLDYCEQDVRVTYKLWVYGATHGYVLYPARTGEKKRANVNWSLPPGVKT